MAAKRQLFLHPDYLNTADYFFNNYDLKMTVFPGDKRFSKRARKKYTDRVCLFCGRKYPGVRFSNFAHLMPQAIGNRNLYSDFECDDCNRKFGYMENELSNYLGISRSILGLQNEKKAPGLDAKKLSVKSRSFAGHNILILAPEDIHRNTEVPGEINIRYIKNPYTPGQVYKAILKSSLSVLGILEATGNYDFAIEYLNSDIEEQHGALLLGYHLPVTFNQPLQVYLFEKKDPAAIIPTHVVLFYFQNYIIALPVPFHKNDMKFQKDIKLVFPPAFFLNEANVAAAYPQTFKEDLSSVSKLTDQEESIRIRLNRGDINNSFAYDIINDQYLELTYDGESIKYLIVTMGEASFDPKELSGFINKQIVHDEK